MPALMVTALVTVQINTSVDRSTPEMKVSGLFEAVEPAQVLCV
jgi:hypothetical protein